MKGFRKSILMGAVLAWLLSTAAGAMSASEDFSGVITEQTTEILTGAESEMTAEDLEKEPIQTVPEDLTEELIQTALEDLTEEPIQTVPEDLTEEPMQTVPEDLTKEPMQTVPEDLTKEPMQTGTEALTEEPVQTVPEAITEEPVQTAAEVLTEERMQTDSEAGTEAALREARETEEEYTEEIQTEAPEEEPSARRVKEERLAGEYLTVTWSREKDKETLVYTQGEDDEAIKNLEDGRWELFIQVAMQVPGMEPLKNGSYFCELVWPDAADREISLVGSAGDIRIENDFVCGSWVLSDRGELSLTFDDINKLSNVSGWIKTFVQAGAEETKEPVVNPANPFVDKEGFFDAAAQKVFWTAEVTVPAWDGGRIYSWCLHDTEKTTPGALKESFQNDYSEMTVENEEGTAWFYEEADDGSALIWFLNPCSCETDKCEGEEPGQSDGQCGHIKYIDGSGQAWCTCWHRKENSRFVLGYSADTAGLQQQMQESEIKEAMLINFAELLQSGEWANSTEARVQVHQAIKKAESERPDSGNSYSSTCQIIVNPSFDDYSDAAQIEVTDVMENLTYINESLQVVCRYSDGTEGTLTQIEGEEAAGLGREGNENCFYSIETAENGQSFCVRLWYPTQASYTLTYRAAVTELVPGAQTSYQNTATLGNVSSTVIGRGFRVDDAWSGETFEAEVLKIDADSGIEDPKGLSGAVFEVRQVSGEGEDLLVDTLITDEDGKDVFGTNREKGILVDRNTLYYLQETEAPKGYERKEEKYYFYFSPEDDMILPEGITAVKGEKKEDEGIPTYTLTLVVPNQAEAPKELPSAGGPGDALFFVIGLFFVFASGRPVFLRGMY